MSDISPGRRIAVKDARAWAADFIVAVANSDREAIRLMLRRLEPGIDTQAVLLLLADICGHADPRLVAEATGRSLAKSAPRKKAA